MITRMLKINETVVQVELTDTVINGYQFVYALEGDKRAARHRLPSEWLLGNDRRRVFTSGNWYGKV